MVPAAIVLATPWTEARDMVSERPGEEGAVWCLPVLATFRLLGTAAETAKAVARCSDLTNIIVVLVFNRADLAQRVTGSRFR